MRRRRSQCGAKRPLSDYSKVVNRIMNAVVPASVVRSLKASTFEKILGVKALAGTDVE
jgi:hypothetical protein